MNRIEALLAELHKFSPDLTELGSSSEPQLVANYPYTEEEVPEVVYHSFLNFVEEVVIGWTLEEYDYEGNER